MKQPTMKRKKEIKVKNKKIRHARTRCLTIIGAFNFQLRAGNQIHTNNYEMDSQTRAHGCLPAWLTGCMAD